MQAINAMFWQLMLRMGTLYFPADAVIGRAAIYLKNSSALADKVIYTNINEFLRWWNAVYKDDDHTINDDDDGGGGGDKWLAAERWW